jgi:hypothetical protein
MPRELNGWMASVSQIVSYADSHETIRHYCPKLAQTLLKLTFISQTNSKLMEILQPDTHKSGQIPAILVKDWYGRILWLNSRPD